MHPDYDPLAAAWDAAVREHEESLRVGTRVRIMPGEGCHHHGTQEAGVTGVIAAKGQYTRAGAPPDHLYVVVFDRPLPITRTVCWTWEYAAGELVPVPWPTPEEIVADVLREMGKMDRLS